ncbi:MAG: 2-hydroxyacid dehydrogenase [Spirochaetaceae bacterium]|nr:2-hydroxyacid dehydrogenase [Spirochaetaceae bacterium]
MKIIFHTHLALDFPDRVAAFTEHYPQHQFLVVRGKDELFAHASEAEVLVDHRINEELLDAAPKLKWVFIPFTGVNFLPWELLTSRGVRVCNNHGNARIVAERALALALDAMGRVSEFDRGMRRGRWHRREGREEPFVLWTSLSGSRAAILGTGAIGTAIAEFLAPFTDNIIGFRRRSGGQPGANFREITDDIETALRGARICFISLPLTPSTEGLIGAEELSLMEGGFLVNVSRGGIVAEEPLYQALSDGVLSGAGLDVWYRYPEPFTAECLPSDYPFHELENVVLSPHAGSHAPEGKMGQLEGTLENLAALIETGEPRDIADPLTGY